MPNIRVSVTCDMVHLSDWSVLGDWIGKQVRPEWNTPYGPMPYITGLPEFISFASKKALTAAAANYGCALLWVEGHTWHTQPPRWMRMENSSSPKEVAAGELTFGQSDLEDRYAELAPKDKSTSWSSAALKPAWKS